MAIPVVCQHCGAFFLSAAVGGNVNVVMTDTLTNCPACGAMTSMDGHFAVRENQTVVLSAPWLNDFERAVRRARLTKDQARKIQRKVIKTKDMEALAKSVRRINTEVAEAVDQVIFHPIPEKDKWQWLYRIAAVVGIVAGVNTFSSDYNIDTAIKWVKSQRPQHSENPSTKISDNEPPDQSHDDDDSGPR